MGGDPRGRALAASTGVGGALQHPPAVQRSSSGVEGRNGQLALHHQGRHRLSDRKLAALTVVHNYHIRRADDLDRPSSPI
ncbi:DUF6399 domain-containing protein [Candidatus Accumulibacter contiguus]|uniref:DUF6399 domain-containing protein n=1 Tax=Candidatus Accumulibacter contiguus TaxID=2954381 RepID=UPI002FC2D545